MGKLRSAFEKKYGFDGVDFVKKAGQEYFGMAKSLGIDSLLIGYAKKKGVSLPMNEKGYSKLSDAFKSDLIQAMAEAGEKFPKNQKARIEFFDNLEVTPIDPSVPKSKGALQDFKNIVGSDVFRLVMQGVYVSDDGFLVGTDAHKLVKYKSNEFSKDKGKIIDLKIYIGTNGEKISFIDEKYPNYEAVIPRNNEFKVNNLNTYAFYNLCKSAIVLKKLQDSDIFNIHFKEKGVEFALNPIIFAELLEFALAKGFDNFNLEFSAPNRAFLLKFEDGSEGLIMPILAVDNKGTKVYTFDQVESEFSGGGKTKTKGKALPKSTSKEPKKDIPYKKFEGDLSDVTYIPRRDISLIVLKNGEELSSANIIDGVYKLNSKKKFAEGGTISEQDINKMNKLELIRYISSIDPSYPIFTRRDDTKLLREDAKKLRQGKLSENKFAKGGQVGNKFRGIDLFQDYEYQEPKLRAITKKIDEAYDNDEVNTKFLQSILDKTESIGYTFELDMDGSAYGLRPIGVEVEELEGYDEYAKGGSVKKGLTVAKKYTKLAVKKAKPVVKKGVKVTKKYGKIAIKKSKPIVKKGLEKAKIGFDALAKKVAKSYEGSAVQKKYQSLYGKIYSKKEAEEVGNKVASKVYRQQQGMK